MSAAEPIGGELVDGTARANRVPSPADVTPDDQYVAGAQRAALDASLRRGATDATASD